MSEWKKTKIHRVCQRVISGGTPLRSRPEYYEDGIIPWLKTGEVKQGYIYNTSEKITELGLSSSSAKLVPKNSVIVAMYGDGDTAGSVGVNKIDLATNQACCNLIIDEGIAHYRYVYFYLKGNYNNLVNLKLGGSQQNLNARTIKEFDILLPPLDVQKKITAVLSAYDDLIENNNKRIALLEKAAEEIYREWFVRLRFPGRETAVFEKGIPEGWESVPSSSVLDVLSGGTPKTSVSAYWDGQIPFFTPKDAEDNFYVLNTEKYVTEKGLDSCNSALYQKNTIFITARGTVGKICLAAVDMAMNQSCYALRPKNDGEVYFYFLTMKNSIKYIKGVSKSGVFDNIIVDTFKIIPFLMPSSPFISKFNEKMKPIFQEIECLMLSNINLSTTRDLLLSRLISGKLSVDDLDIQFPPSMLTT